MPEEIRVVVDPRGAVHVELSGYPDERCEGVERDLRRRLVELGLLAEVTARRRKTPAERAAETRGRSPAARGLGAHP
jgi:hypothetical protein